MFKWLADLIVKTPVQGTCSCCEGQKERLRQMQKVILNADDSGESENSGAGDSGCCCNQGGVHGDCCGGGHDEETYSCHCGGKGGCHGDCTCGKHVAPEAVDYSEMTRFSSASYSLSCRFDAEAQRYHRSAKYVPAGGKDD